jgi:hypothetical protein
MDFSSPALAVLVGIVLAVALLVLMTQARARNAYYESLERLRNDPHNAALLAKTLALGRTYARHAGWFATNRPGVVDEAALIRDINAFCAQREAAGPRATVEERLAQLARLQAKGLITESEYQSTRQRIQDEAANRPP